MKSQLKNDIHPVVRVIYYARTFGCLLIFLCATLIFYREKRLLIWGIIIFHGLIWPHLAYFITRKSTDPKTAEYRNVLIDCFLYGAWIPILSFRILVIPISIMASCVVSITIGGFRLLFFGLISMCFGIAGMTLLVGFHFISESTPSLIVSFYLIVILFPSAIGFLNYNQTKLLVKMREEVKRQRDLLDNISKIDGLTNIPNRRRFDEYMDLQWQNAMRSKSPLSIIMLDIDHFKAYNDFYGHACGDECLKKVAATLSQSIHRPIDMIARYGGEEFVCLLPATDLAGARTLAEKMRKNVFSLSIPHEKSSAAGYITISLGLSSIVPTKALRPAILLKQADSALYMAKKESRNTCKVYVTEEMPALPEKSF